MTLALLLLGLWLIAALPLTVLLGMAIRHSDQARPTHTTTEENHP